MPLLSVAIITCNEERNLARTLASVSFADEVIVVDSGSTDRTVEIARSFGARVFVREWPGFSAQKNFAIQQCSGKWVLSLDADEELSPELRTQIRLLLPSNPPADAFFLKRRNRLPRGAGSSTAATTPTPSCASSAVPPRISRSSPASKSAPSTRPSSSTANPRPSTSTSSTTPTPPSTTTSSTWTATPTWAPSCSSPRAAPAVPGPPSGGTSSSSPTSPSPTTTFSGLGFLDGREGLLLHLYHTAYISWKYAKAWRLSLPRPKLVDYQPVESSKPQSATAHSKAS